MEPLKSKPSRWKRLAKRLVPVRVQEHIRELRGLSSLERRAHLGATFRRIAHVPAAVPPALDTDASILFVCHGNIIRSALAAALTRRHATELGLTLPSVQSAGLLARPGREADPRAVAAGQSLGVDLHAHRAQALSRALVDESSVIYVMDRLNEAQLLARFPDAAPKLRRLGALAVTSDGDVIADPFVLDAAAVAEVAARIDRATRELTAELSRRGTTPR